MTSLKDVWEDDESGVKSQAAAPIRQQGQSSHAVQQFMQHPQQMIQNPQQMMKYPQQMMQNPQHIMQHPQQVMQHPQQMMQFPQQIIQYPQQQMITPSRGNISNLIPDDILRQALAASRVESSTTTSTSSSPPPPPPPPIIPYPDDKKEQQERDIRLLNNINQMLGSSEDFLLRKFTDIQKIFVNQTQKTLIDNIPEQIPPPFDWAGVICIFLVIILFVTVLVIQQCNFSKIIASINTIQLKNVNLKVLYPELI
jgi:hypothetical protein